MAREWENPLHPRELYIKGWCHDQALKRMARGEPLYYPEPLRPLPKLRPDSPPRQMETMFLLALRNREKDKEPLR